MAQPKQREQTSTRRRPPRTRSRAAATASFCRDKVEEVDYKNIAQLRRFVSERGKIRSRRITGACRRHQVQVGQGGQARARDGAPPLRLGPVACRSSCCRTSRRSASAARSSTSRAVTRATSSSPGSWPSRRRLHGSPSSRSAPASAPARRPRRSSRRASSRPSSSRRELRFDVKAGPTGSLFGSVTPTDLADEIWRVAKIRVDRRRIALGEPIKKVGRYAGPDRALHRRDRRGATLVVPEGGELPPEESGRRPPTEPAGGGRAEPVRSRPRTTVSREA